MTTELLLTLALLVAVFGLLVGDALDSRLWHLVALAGAVVTLLLVVRLATLGPA